jgi:hypothetical protein
MQFGVRFAVGLSARSVRLQPDDGGTIAPIRGVRLKPDTTYC